MSKVFNEEIYDKFIIRKIIDTVLDTMHKYIYHEKYELYDIEIDSIITYLLNQNYDYEYSHQIINFIERYRDSIEERYFYAVDPEVGRIYKKHSSKFIKYETKSVKQVLLEHIKDYHPSRNNKIFSLLNDYIGFELLYKNYKIL